MMREKILNFMQWNDRNGCYTDKNCIEEGYEPLTFKEAIKMFVSVIGEVDDWYEINIKEEVNKKPIIKEALEILINNDDTIYTYKKIIEIL